MPVAIKSPVFWICLLSILLLNGCTDQFSGHLPEAGDGRPAWQPCIELEKGDGQAILHISNPLPSISYTGSPPQDPDYFNIWVSQGPDDQFELYQKVGIRTTRVVMDGLQNGRPVYVFVTSHKDNSIDSTGVLMTIPSLTHIEVFSADMDSPVEHFAASVDLSFVSFIRTSHLYVKGLNDASPILTERTGIMASWSPSSNQIVYITTKDEGNIRYPHSMKLYEAPQGKTTTLLDIDYHDYYVQTPAFTPDGSEITFLSSEGNSEKIFYDVWVWNLLKGEKKRLTDFSKADFILDGGYCWGKSGDELYISGSFGINAVANIYKLDIASGAISPIIVSSWNDSSPSLSPDKSMLAFISDRTGRDELWLFSLEDSSLSQLTGSRYTFDSRYSSPNWLGNDHLLMTVYDGQSWVPVTVKVN